MWGTLTKGSGCEFLELVETVASCNIWRFMLENVGPGNGVVSLMAYSRISRVLSPFSSRNFVGYQNVLEDDGEFLRDSSPQGPFVLHSCRLNSNNLPSCNFLRNSFGMFSESNGDSFCGI